MRQYVLSSWGYHDGDNYVKYDNSPAGWLLSLRDDARKTWGYGYGGTSVINKNSPGMWLHELRDYVQTSWGYHDGADYVLYNNSPAGWLKFLREDVQYIRQYGLTAWGYHNGGDYVTYSNSPAGWLKDVQSKVQDLRDNSLTAWGYHDGEKYVSYDNSPAGWLKSILAVQQSLSSSAVSNGNLVSKGFSDVLGKLDGLSVSVDVDLSGVESRLDSIIRLLSVAGVVENAKDVLDAIFGDMSLDATEAASAAVSSAIQNAFPFCVPAVLKQILGLLQADPAPPEFHFDFWGAPLDFGFSDWQGLADMTSWLSRIGFAVVLFANSRRFVYSGGVAGD